MRAVLSPVFSALRLVAYSAMHDSLAKTSKGNMIDNPDEVERLIAKLRQSLPLLATVTPEVAAIIRERSPAAADPQR